MKNKIMEDLSEHTFLQSLGNNYQMLKDIDPNMAKEYLLLFLRMSLASKEELDEFLEVIGYEA